MSKRIEANNFVKQAEKCLKTSFLKWSADIDGAIENYANAAKCFKEAKDYDESIKYYLKVSEMQATNDSLFYSAKTMEEAADVYREQRRYKEMTELILKAGQTFRINGTADSATQMMHRIAKSIEYDAPEEGARLYLLASEASQDKDNLREAGEYASLAAKLFLRANNFESAKTTLESKLRLFSEAGDCHEAGKAVVCLVLIHLYNNDFVGAAKVYSNCIERNNFSSSQDCSHINQLLNAVDNSDYDEARKILKGHTFLYLENDFVKLAREIKFPESTKMTTVCEGDGPPRYDLDDDIN